MTCDEFTELLERDSRLRAAAYRRTELRQFVASNWEQIVRDPDVRRWVEAFFATGKAFVID